MRSPRHSDADLIDVTVGSGVNSLGMAAEVNRDWDDEVQSGRDRGRAEHEQPPTTTSSPIRLFYRVSNARSTVKALLIFDRLDESHSRDRSQCRTPSQRCPPGPAGSAVVF